VRPWKLLGLAGLAGVAATGAVLARSERQRRAYTPEDVRARLHARAAELADTDQPPAPVTAPGPGRRARLLRRLRPRHP
jgi:hypothetical protein